MFRSRAPMWVLATALAIVLLTVSARPLLGGGGGLPVSGQQNQPPSTPAQDNCAACHSRLNDRRLSAPVTLFSSDIHREKGFGCASCHGGDASREGVDAMDPRRGYIGKPPHERIPDMCARCHADAAFMRRYNPAIRVDQLAEYRTSVHGRRLAEQKDLKVATCASCHSPHSIRPASDPQSSVHPTRVVDTCGGCHANAGVHGVTWHSDGPIGALQEECPLAHAGGSRRYLGANLQRLSREPRRGPAWGRLGRQRLRPVPRRTGGTLPGEPACHDLPGYWHTRMCDLS